MEQNIDDILKLLKDSVAADQTPTPIEKTNRKQKDISTEALQAQLKNQYIFDASDVVTETDSHSEPQGEYVIDSDFLNEALRDIDDTLSEDGANPDLTAEKDMSPESTIERIELSEHHEAMINEYEQRETTFSSVLVMEQEQEAVVDDLVMIEVSDDANTEPIEIIDETEVIKELEEIKKNEEINDIPDDENDITQENTVSEEILLIEDDEVFEEQELPVDNTEELIAGLKPIEDEPQYAEAILDSSEDIEDTENDISDDEWELPADSVDELIASLKPTQETSKEEELALEDISEEQTIIETGAVLEDIEPISDDITKIVEGHTDEKLEPHETFLASMRRTGMDFTTEDIYNSTLAKQNEESEPQDVFFMEDATDDEVIERDSIIEEELDPSTINLMMQFCEKDELEETIGDKKVDEFLKHEHATVSSPSVHHVADGKEYVDHEQTEKIRLAYKKKRTSKLISLISCAFIALVAIIYEILPLADVRLAGALDYHKYPSVYALIGLQLVVFAGAIWHKELWRGLKRAFSLSPTPNSVVALILALTAIYDAIVVIILAFTGDGLPHMYNGIAVCIITIAILAEYFDTVSQMRSFCVYSSEACKYTLIKESSNGSIGSKMYGGGLEEDKAIYTIKPVDFPSGFFRSVSAGTKKNKIMTSCIIPVLVVGMIASVIAILIGSDAYAACAAFMLCVYAIMPVVLVLTNSLPYAIACKRLSKRGSAFAGQGAIDKYSDCDVMVFNDLHMFKKCRTEDVGIVIYDNKVGYLVLGCLDALYSRIGGPMSSLQMNLPDVFKFDNVAIKRMTRNGIEAVIDKKHTLIVGEQAFMQRYGLEFPPNEQNNGRSTLCVSLNGKVTAKLSVRYEAEPVFEMLAERLYAEGITCAVHTFDPLINSGVISSSRTIGESPISVIHGNAKDFGENDKLRYNADADGVISCASRLKLAEIEVWLRRLSNVKSMCEKIALGYSVFGALMLILLVSVGATAYVNQLHILLYLGLEVVTAGLIMAWRLPSKKYFTVDALYSELEALNAKKMLQTQKIKAKQAKKAAK